MDAEDKSALDASERVVRIIDALPAVYKNDDRPVRDYLPGAWLSVGEFKRLVKLARQGVTQ